MNALEALTTGTDFATMTWGKMLITMVASVLYGIIVMILYRLYHRKNEPYDLSISRSFPLIAPSVTAIFWLIQFSLPLSLGLLGALSFVRFRTPVKRAEDIAFILMIIAGGLASSVNQFAAAAVLVLIIAGYSFLRHRLAHRMAHANIGNLAIHSEDSNFLEKWTAKKDKKLEKFNLVSLISKDSLVSLFFSSSSLSINEVEEIKATVKSIDPKAKAEFFFPDNQMGI